jgi:GH35 family endo-1,4-beta-xylanase
MGADMKGVAMLYASIMVPSWVNSIDPNTVKARFLAYITHAVTTFGNKITQWEIIDELALPYPSNSEGQTSPALTNLYKREGVKDLIWEVYNTVKGIDPSALLEINDYNINELYFSLIERLQSGGVYPFDAIKIQSHMQEDVWSAQKLFWVLDKLSTYNQNLHMSEISLFSGKPTYTGTAITDWFTSAAGEAAQAIEAERFLKLAFSHQYVKSISYWDLTDYMAWCSEQSMTGAGSWARGLLRPDMTKKPAFDVVHDLIKTQWWTITSGITAGLGNFNFRGFAGTYDVTVTRSGYIPKTESVTLTTAGDTWTITMASL